MEFVLDVTDADGAGWRGQLRRPDGSVSTLRLQPPPGTPRPAVHDGLVVAILPAAMRTGGTLRVRGALTRGALRNLTEYAEAWANWGPDRFHHVTLAPDAIVDGHAPASGHDAVFAWSGSLRSTHTLVRHRDGLVPGAFGVRAALRVEGLRPGDDTSERVRQALAPDGVPLLTVRTNAAAAGFVDPEIGALPIVAGALHLVGAGATAGFHARSWSFAAQMRYPRPGPALQDLLSGDGFTVRADGGATSPPRMAADVLRHPSLAAGLSDCHRVPRAAAPCGRCGDCTLTALAFAALGAPPPHGRRVRRWRVAALALVDPVRAADAAATLADWPPDDSTLRAALATRTALGRVATDLRDTARWFGSAAGLRAPWPR